MTIDPQGNLYGSTRDGGSGGNNSGTLFKIAAGTIGLTTLATFNPTNGSSPQGALSLDADGNLFGTTYFGGAYGDGTIFKLAAGTNTITALVSFNRAANPTGGLRADRDGRLVGTTFGAGTQGGGTVFRYSPNTNSLVTLANLNSATGTDPESAVTFDAAGNVYGTTNSGGPNGGGTVFRIDATTGAFTTIAAFDQSSGGLFGGVVVDHAGNVFGTTFGNSTDSSGTLFKIAAGSNVLSTVLKFSAQRGPGPQTDLLIDASGNLFGIAGGGPDGHGSVFRLAADGTLATLATFAGTSNGYRPSAALIADAAGNLFGATAAGGANGAGTVFKLTDTGFVVPEPASLAVAALTGVLTTRRRRASVR